MSMPVDSGFMDDSYNYASKFEETQSDLVCWVICLKGRCFAREIIHERGFLCLSVYPVSCWVV